MEEHPLEQSSFGRAWADTKHFYHNILFWGVEVLLTVVGGFVGNALTPATVGNFESALYPAIGSVTGAIVGFAIIYLVFLFLAPYRQRNQARNLLRAKPKPIPLQNRKELIEAIASVENTTIQLINKQHELDKMTAQSPYMISTVAAANKDRAYARWNDSMNELRRQYLVAGDAFEKIAVDFTGFVAIQVMSKMGQIKHSEDIKPLVVQDVLRFAGALGVRVKETIRKIDEISGQVPYKENSQS